MTYVSPSFSRHQKGVGLIEVMVSILILAIAFIGVAVLQARSLSANSNAITRSMATMASYSILDAIRIDRDNATRYNSTITAGQCNTTGNGLVGQALGHWCQSLTDNVGGDAKGTIKCSGDGVCTITIVLDGNQGGATHSTQKIITKAKV